MMLRWNRSWVRIPLVAHKRCFMAIRQFPCTVKRWVDGDTVIANVDLGFKVYSEITFRLAGINTPERGQPGYVEAADRAEQLAPIGSNITVDCHGHDKYGRWVATIIRTENQINVNELLLKEGYAKEYK